MQYPPPPPPDMTVSAPEPSRIIESAATLSEADYHVVDLMNTFGGGGPIDRRWQIAAVFVHGLSSRYFFRHFLDADVRLAVRYLRRRAKNRDIGNELTYLDGAWRLRFSGDRLGRVVVEARLLAAQSIDETAARCQLSVETVRLYASLFFDVQRKLNARPYIIREAIGERFWTGFTSDDVDIIIKSLAYQKGPLFLDYILPYFTTSWQIPDCLDELKKEQLAQLKDMIWVRVLVESMTRRSAKAIAAYTRLLAGEPTSQWERLARELEELIATLPISAKATSLSLSAASVSRLIDSFAIRQADVNCAGEADGAVGLAG